MAQEDERKRYRDECDLAMDTLFDTWAPDGQVPRAVLLALLELLILRLIRIETGTFPPNERPTEPQRRIDTATFRITLEETRRFSADTTREILRVAREASGLDVQKDEKK